MIVVRPALDARVTVDLTDSEKLLAKRAARKANVSLSAYVRGLIRRDLRA